MSGKNGMRKRAPMGEQRGRQRMWQAMRVLRQFSIADIVATAEVTTTAARKYVRALADEYYVQCVRPRRSGYSGGHALWRLAIDSGPYAPRIGALGLRDPNREAHAAEPMVSVSRRDYERALACVRACAGLDDPEREVAALRAAR